MPDHTPEPCGCQIDGCGSDCRRFGEIAYCPTHAAAPALLAALRECADKVGMAQLKGVRGCGPILSRARRAIAKAKGTADA